VRRARFSSLVQTSLGAHLVTGYWLSFPGDEWPGRGANHPPHPARRYFSLLKIIQTGCGAHSASYSMGAGFFFPSEMEFNISVLFRTDVKIERCYASNFPYTPSGIKGQSFEFTSFYNRYWAEFSTLPYSFKQPCRICRCQRKGT
jgi:hypothetical protein